MQPQFQRRHEAPVQHVPGTNYTKILVTASRAVANMQTSMHSTQAIQVFSNFYGGISHQGIFLFANGKTNANGA